MYINKKTASEKTASTKVQNEKRKENEGESIPLSFDPSDDRSNTASETIVRKYKRKESDIRLNTASEKIEI